MIAYKVTDVNMGSIVIRGDGECKYVLNKAIKPMPNYGPLCTFISEARAKYFVREFIGRIFKCRIKKSQSKAVWIGKHLIHICSSSRFSYIIEGDHS